MPDYFLKHHRMSGDEDPASVMLDRMLPGYPTAASAQINSQRYLIEDGVSRFVGFVEA